MRKQNISRTVEIYVQEHPSVKDCLKQGLINYSKLSRTISKELSIQKKYFDAVLVSLRRCERKLKGDISVQRKIRQILKKSKIQLKNKIVDVILDKKIKKSNLIDLQKDIEKAGGEIHIIHGASAIALITNQEFLTAIESYFKNHIIKINKDLVEVVLQTNIDIEDTPGVVSYLTSLLSGNNVNIVETLSTYIDTIFVLDSNNAGKAIELLTF